MDLSYFLDEIAIPMLLNNEIWKMPSISYVNKELSTYKGNSVVFYYLRHSNHVFKGQDIKEWFTQNVESTFTKKKDDLMDDDSFWHWYSSYRSGDLCSFVVGFLLDRILSMVPITHRGMDITGVKIAYGKMMEGDYARACGCYTPRFLVSKIRDDQLIVDNTTYSFYVHPLVFQTKEGPSFAMDLACVRYGKELVQKYPDAFTKSKKHNLSYFIAPLTKTQGETSVEAGFFEIHSRRPISAWEIPIYMEVTSSYLSEVFGNIAYLCPNGEILSQMGWGEVMVRKREELVRSLSKNKKSTTY